ncbi:MAG TPA: carboxypeptidase regulatory-like domain-containing protein [Jatrophihabitans sp.]|uniref:carboxypeptidase regulatory-like domain-containing protein n=1 Tax=Jatrophihabitans sp. TaxID=1932789 RepID=UPI002F10624B
MAPGPVTGLTVTANALHSISLEWAVPKDADLAHVLIRRAIGDQPPLSASDGTLVAILGSHATEFTDQKLDGGTAYSYAVYASDRQRNLSTPSTVSASTLTTNDRTGIRGVLTDKQGHPIAGVSVEVNAVDGGYAGEATTGADGSYRVTNIQPGTYTVCFQVTSQTKGSSPTGYFNGCYRQQPFGSGNSGTPVTVTAGKTVNGINDYLAVAGAISGRITDPSGTGLGNVRVYVTSPWDAYHSATSSADGGYTITGLPADSYRVCFDASHATGAASTGYLDECYDNQPQWNATAIPVRLGHTTRGINAVLAVGGAVTGTVTDPAGNPAAGVIAFLRPSGGRDITDAQGLYRISGIAPGAYTVCVNGPEGTSTTAPYGYITGCGPDVAVVAGQTVTQHRTLQLAGAIGGSVSGPDGSPVAGVWMTVFDSAGIAIDTLTDESGNWQLAGLGAGQYTVCYDPSFTSGGFRRGCYDGQPSGATTGTPVTVTGGQLTTVNEALVPGATIRGTVSDKDGRPIDSVRVSLIPLAGAGFLDFAFTDDAGSYTLAGLDPGSYAVCFDASWTQGSSGLGYSSECYDNQPSADTADPVVVADAGTVRVDAALADGPAITGRVTDPNGVGVPSVRVVATSTTSDQSNDAFTDWDGSYQVSGLLAGDYTVCFHPGSSWDGPPTGYVQQCWRDQQSPAGGAPVHAEASTITSGIDAQLRIGGAVTGTVTDASGMLLNEAYVDVRGTDGVHYDSSYLTDSTGQYTLVGLPAIPLVICFRGEYWDPGAYLRQCYRNAPDESSATAVTPTPGEFTSGIDAVLQSAD